MGRWRGVAVPRGTRMSSGRFRPVRLLRSVLGAVVADSLLDAATHCSGGAVGAALPCALALAPCFSWPTVTAIRAGQPSWAWKRENYYNGDHARDCCLDRS